MEDTKPQIQKVFQTPDKAIEKKTTLVHKTVQQLKTEDKEKNHKST